MEEALRRQNIPYRIYGGLSFYQRKEVKDLLSYFRLAINNHDEMSLKRIINYPARGIGDTTIDKIVVCANDHNISMWTVIENVNEFDIGLNSGTKTRLDEFSSMIKSFTAMLSTHNAYDLGNHIAVHSGILRDLYADKTPEGVSRYENIQELLNGLKEFTDAEIVEEEGAEQGQNDLNPELPLNNKPESTKQIELKAQAGELFFEAETPISKLETENPEQETENIKLETLSSKQITGNSLTAFMQDIALMTDADKEVQTEEDKNKVSLMTIHASKGLEFPYVYIVGLEENLFPSQMSLTDRTDLEEERRLFYVAVTRAEKKATLSYSTTRYRWGNLIYCEPSRFIDEIDSKYLDMSAVGSNAMFEQEDYSSRPKVQVKKTEFVQRPIMGKKLVKASTATKATTDFDTESLRGLQVGMQVEHERFGFGKVISMEGTFPNNKATVFFEGAGQKQLLIKFAKLRIV
jgi:DNA helicase II / ATP-dependent DNA helicase PcrA